jgi:hypothetical protein
MQVSLGPEPTERQQLQRDLTHKAAEVLRRAGFRVLVADLVCGERFPEADAAMITIEVPNV